MFVFYCGSVLLIFLFYTLTQLRVSLCPSRRLAEMHRGNITELARSLRRCGKRPTPTRRFTIRIQQPLGGFCACDFAAWANARSVLSRHFGISSRSDSSILLNTE